MLASQCSSATPPTVDAVAQVDAVDRQARRALARLLVGRLAREDGTEQDRLGVLGGVGGEQLGAAFS